MKDQAAATATSVGGKATASADDLAANAPAGSKITVGTKTVTLIKDDGAKVELLAMVLTIMTLPLSQRQKLMS